MFNWFHSGVAQFVTGFVVEIWYVLFCHSHSAAHTKLLTRIPRLCRQGSHCYVFSCYVTLLSMFSSAVNLKLFHRRHSACGNWQLVELFPFYCVYFSETSQVCSVVVYLSMLIKLRKRCRKISVCHLSLSLALMVVWRCDSFCVKQAAAVTTAITMLTSYHRLSQQFLAFLSFSVLCIFRCCCVM